MIMFTHKNFLFLINKLIVTEHSIYTYKYWLEYTHVYKLYYTEINNKLNYFV